jgi:TonB family protein
MLPAFQRYWHADQDELQLLLEFYEPADAPRLRLAFAGAVLYQVLVVLLALTLPAGGSRSDSAHRVVVDVSRATPLIAPRNLPPFKVTQKEPNRSKPVAEVDLAALLPQPEIRQNQRTPAGRPFNPPPAPPSRPAPAPAPVIEAPRIELPQAGLPNVPQVAQTKPLNVPPPPEPPKVANPFERVGTPQGLPNASNRGPGQTSTQVAPPRNSIEDAARAVTRNSAGRGPTVTDMGAGGGGGILEGAIQKQSPSRNGSALEMLSDPQGIDFRPYLIQVLAAVKRNWQAVLPESARFGLPGRVAIQFSINKVGGVPKLVIALPSGTEALDRAAVAGISASNPFPPLPAEYRGSEIHLQLVFSYNMPR